VIVSDTVSIQILTKFKSLKAYANFPYNPTWAIWGFILALVLIALGMGGIKSNVAPLMADQLGPNATADQLETVFRYFYWAINFGALIGMLLSPLVKRFGLTFPAPANASTAADVCASSNDPYTGYYVAYAMFTGVFGLAIVVFMYGYSFYVGYPPSGSMLARHIVFEQEENAAMPKLVGFPFLRAERTGLIGPS